jgi:DNA-binding cell septation regulator SpoVG
MIHGLQVIKHSNGYLVAMPQTKRSKCPITSEARRVVEEAVMAEYRKLAAEAANSSIEKTG